jgi:hypothetical protein
VSGHPARRVITALLDMLGPPPGDDGIRHANGPGLAVADEQVPVRVFDGPPLDGIDEPDVIGIGLSGGGNGEATGSTRPGYGGAHQIEQFDIGCLAQSWSGDVAIGVHRDRAFDLFDAVVARLEQDPRVRGTCERARVGRWAYRAIQTGEGSIAVIEFSVRVDTRRM